MKVEDGARFNLNSDQIMIGLTSSTEWAKEIQAWQYCLCGVATVHQDSANSNPVWMLATSDQVATIVFRKPKFLGIWTDMYHFEPEQFWRLLGGKVLTFDWKCDYCNCV
jgi:hypothetical protein